MINKNITNMIENYKTFEKRLLTETLRETINRKSEFHVCDEIKEVNKQLNTSVTKQIYKDDDIEWVYILKDIKCGVWTMCISYWNDEYDHFEIASMPVLICPYCGQKLE